MTRRQKTFEFGGLPADIADDLTRATARTMTREELAELTDFQLTAPVWTGARVLGQRGLNQSLEINPYQGALTYQLVNF